MIENYSSCFCPFKTFLTNVGPCPNDLPTKPTSRKSGEQVCDCDIYKKRIHAHNKRPGAAPSGQVVGRLPPGRKPRGQVYVDEHLSLGLNPIQLSRPIGLDFIVSRYMKFCLPFLKRSLSVS
jgi:hypothetical protein